MRPESYQRATFDGGADDPRLLIHLYQQRLRTELLAKAAEEASRPPALVRFVMSLWAATQTTFRPWRRLAVERESAPPMAPGLSLGEGAA